MSVEIDDVSNPEDAKRQDAGEKVSNISGWLGLVPLRAQPDTACITTQLVYATIILRVILMRILRVGNLVVR